MSKDKPKKGIPTRPKGGWKGKKLRVGPGNSRCKKGR